MFYYVEAYQVIAWTVLVISFVMLAKSADIFVESAVELSNRLNIPKLLIGLVLVSFATTAPELTVSLMAAIKGNPEMALGNAIGSVICDDGLALGLAGIFAIGTIKVIPSVLRSSGSFLLFIATLAFIFTCFDFTLSRGEGATLVVLFAMYLYYTYRQHRLGKIVEDLDTEAPESFHTMSGKKMIFLFLLGLTGILLGSELLVVSATSIATHLHVPEAMIALTLVALGTSIPEVATCITAAKKGHGDIAVGNILGADILNICWVAGASAIANNLVLTSKQIYFMFPVMFVVILAMLIMLRSGFRLTKAKGYALLSIYLAYLILSFFMFPPKSDKIIDTENNDISMQDHPCEVL